VENRLLHEEISGSATLFIRRAAADILDLLSRES
jgi:hypothetical protein